MQYNLMGEPSALAKVNEILTYDTQTAFFLMVLEELANKHRTDLVGPPPIEEGEDYDPEQDNETRIEEFAERVLGECPEDRTEEEHQSMLKSLTADILDLFELVTDAFLSNPDNSDQINVLANQDFAVPRDFTWTTGQNGGFVFIFK